MQGILIQGISESEKRALEYVSGQDPYKIKGAVPAGGYPSCAYSSSCAGCNLPGHQLYGPCRGSARYRKRPLAESAFAVYFSKRVSEATGTGAEIPSHKELVQDLDYEAELAVIIGKDAKNVPVSR